MPDARTFLIGGGWDPDAAPAVYGPFVRTVAPGAAIRCLVLAGEGADAYGERFAEALSLAGADPASVAVQLVSTERPPRREELEGVGGVLVCGGLTPGYQEVLCGVGRPWFEAVRSRNLPYAGFSAGAALAARRALVGGWRISAGDAQVAVCDEEASEDLDLVEVRDGLGLVPFSVDVHATQWGTVPRLLHAVAQGLTDEGWAIDEDTMVEVAEGTATVHGTGSVYRMRRAEGEVRVTVLPQGTRVAVSPGPTRR